MKIIFCRLALLALILTYVSSCQNHDEDEHDDDHTHTPDNIAPVIQFTSPRDSIIYKIGDTIPIKATITDNGLHELQVYVYRLGGDTLMHQIINVHELTVFNLDTFWPSGSTPAGNMKVSITAQDHGNNLITQYRFFSLAP